MPSKNRNAKNVTKLTCAACAESKKSSEYYMSHNPIHQSGKLPYCKQCLRDMIADEKGAVTLEKLKETLRLIDRPFLYDLWKISLDDKMDTFGCYMKNLQMRQYRELGWADSQMLPEIEKEINYEDCLANEEYVSNFTVTKDIIDKWGNGYKREEYEAFEKKYNLLKNNYSQKTAMHTEALLNYIRYRVKEELATAKGDIKEAKDWSTIANNAATAAKINPSQLSKADLSDGLSTFSELSQAVEKEVDIIPILPKFKYRPNDALDFNIWCYINYIRDLSGLPLCEYEEVYAFYDERKEDYIKQYGDPYGIFTDDTSEKNREKIKNFIKVDGE